MPVISWRFLLVFWYLLPGPLWGSVLSVFMSSSCGQFLAGLRLQAGLSGSFAQDMFARRPLSWDQSHRPRSRLCSGLPAPRAPATLLPATGLLLLVFGGRPLLSSLHIISHCASGPHLLAMPAIISITPNWPFVPSRNRLPKVIAGARAAMNLTATFA